MTTFFHLENALDVVAIYAAIVSTVAIIIDLIRWWTSGPKLILDINFSVHVLRITRKDQPVIMLNVSNVGDRATTISSVFFIGYDNWFKKFVGKPSLNAIVNYSHDDYPKLLTPQLPKKLEVGDIFNHACLQDEFVISNATKKLLYLGVRHAFAKKPLLVRISATKVAPISS